jgi:hypothetical protein
MPGGIMNTLAGKLYIYFELHGIARSFVQELAAMHKVSGGLWNGFHFKKPTQDPENPLKIIVPVFNLDGNPELILTELSSVRAVHLVDLEEERKVFTRDKTPVAA